MVEPQIFNPHREIHILMGGVSWLKASFPPNTETTYVAPGVKLYMDTNINFSASTKYEAILQTFFKKLQSSTPGKIVNGLAKLGQAAAGVESVLKTDVTKNLQILPPEARYQTTLASLPAWDSTEPIDIGSFTFTFYMGMAGVYNGRTEVYNPALALYRVNQPSKQGGILYGPSMSAADAYGLISGSIIKAVQSAANTAVGGVSAVPSASETAGAAFKIEQAISKAVESVETTLRDAIVKKSGVIQLTVGKFKFPPFTVDNSKVEFSKETDNNGFPIKATVSWSGCKTIEMAHKQQIPFLDVDVEPVAVARRGGAQEA